MLPGCGADDNDKDFRTELDHDFMVGCDARGAGWMESVDECVVSCLRKKTL